MWPGAWSGVWSGDDDGNGDGLLLQEMQQQIRHSIEQFSVSDGQGAWQANLHKLVLSYLVHHGYSRTAHVFAAGTGQTLEEDAASIRSRQSE